MYILNDSIVFENKIEIIEIIQELERKNENKCINQDKELKKLIKLLDKLLLNW